MKAKLEKSRFGTQGRSCAFRILWGNEVGIRDEESWFDAIKSSEYLTSAGAWYTLATPDGYIKKFQPSKWTQLISSDNEFKEAERLDKILQPLHKNLFIESNPSPVKYVAKLMGLCDDAVRLPLVTCTDKTKKILEEISKKAQLI